MSILWVGDSPTTPTGFSRVTGELINRLPYPTTLLGINYFGDPHSFPYPIYPAFTGGDAMGFGRIVSVVKDTKPNVVILFNDLWVINQWWKLIKPLQESMGFKVIAYFPVDSASIPEKYTDFLSEVDAIATYTEFGKGVIHRNGIEKDIAIIPHGVDTQSFFPLDKAKARDALGIPADAFVVLNSNRNQPRKRIDITIEAFARFAKNKPSAMLYLHMGSKDVGWDTVDLIATMGDRYGFDLNRRIIHAGSTKNGNFVLERDHPKTTVQGLNVIYNCADVGINTSLGEGWGLCSHEMGAIGIPQIVTDYAASTELFPAGFRVPISQRVIDPDYNLERAFVDPAVVATKLNWIYNHIHQAHQMASAHRERLCAYTWEDAAFRLQSLIEDHHA